jgi:hypothetical protein
MTTTNEIAIIFDNGGGITLQIISESGYRYQHTYNDADHAATDIKAATYGSSPSSWDGNEAEGDDANWIEPTNDQIRNGGYLAITPCEVQAIDPEGPVWGRNVLNLHNAIKAAYSNNT